MKRRNFIGALAAAIGISPAVFGKTEKPKEIIEVDLTDHEQIFREIFFKLHGFPPNSLQMIMFNSYRSGHKWFSQPRQLGMTTFVQALVAYETKVNLKNVCLISRPDFSGYDRFRNLELTMDAKLGKSVKDGKIYIAPTILDTKAKSIDVIFQDNPRIHHLYEFSYPIPIVNFTTHEKYDVTFQDEIPYLRPTHPNRTYRTI